MESFHGLAKDDPLKRGAFVHIAAASGRPSGLAPGDHGCHLLARGCVRSPWRLLLWLPLAAAAEQKEGLRKGACEKMGELLAIFQSHSGHLRTMGLRNLFRRASFEKGLWAYVLFSGYEGDPVRHQRNLQSTDVVISSSQSIAVGVAAVQRQWLPTMSGNAPHGKVGLAGIRQQPRKKPRQPGQHS